MKTFLVLIPPLVAVTVAAQHPKTVPLSTLKEGSVVYEHVIKLDGPFQLADDAVMEKLPKQITETFTLLFGNNQALWQRLPDAAEEAAAVSGNGGNTMRPTRFGGMADVVYYNLENGRRTMQTELGTKTYIVEDSIPKLSWTLSGETKEILGYTVKKATALRYNTRTIMGMENGVLKTQELPDTSTIIAWFAAGIPVAPGPDFCGQLPGLILELEESGGRSTYKAVEISTQVNTASIRAPKRGKRLSAADFRMAQQKMMAEMQQRMQNGGRVSMPLPTGN